MAFDSTNKSWKHWPQCWYAVARADRLPKGGVISGHLAGCDWVLYRSASGAIYAMDGFCPHMGANLKSATVQGESLECGLHACRLLPRQDISPPARGRLTQAGCEIGVDTWRCAEHFGLIWLYPPMQSDALVPFSGKEDSCHWIAAGPLTIAADWRAMICNGFDLSHMTAVHQREVIGEPVFTRTPEGALSMDYRTRILPNGGISSWIMQRLSGGEVVLNHSCIGSSIMVHSKVGKFETQAVFSVLPQDKPGTEPAARQSMAFGAIGMPRHSRWSALRLRVARALYLAFLRKDFRVVEGMNMKLENMDDVGVQAVADYQYGLPGIEE